MKNSENPENAVKDYSIEIKKSAQKFLMNLEDKYFDKIDDKIQSLKSNPHPKNSKKLLVFDCYRVRVGVYRILYTVDYANTKICILDIDNRKDVYKSK